MKRTALGLALVLSVAGSACALHPVADSGYEEPYYASGGERAAYEYEQRQAYEQRRAYEQQRAYEHAAMRDEQARRHAYEHARRDQWERDRAVQAAHERSRWEQHAQARSQTVQVTGHGPVGGRVAPVQAPVARPAPARPVVQPSAPPPQARQAPMARPAPSQPAQNKSRARWVDAHRSVARPE